MVRVIDPDTELDLDQLTYSIVRQMKEALGDHKTACDLTLSDKPIRLSVSLAWEPTEHEGDWHWRWVVPAAQYLANAVRERNLSVFGDAVPPDVNDKAERYTRLWSEPLGISVCGVQRENVVTVYVAGA